MVLQPEIINILIEVWDGIHHLILMSASELVASWSPLRSVEHSKVIHLILR